MKDMFSIGELARYQNISKQTLIFYDKIGLFRPAYVDPDNKYRYYKASQIDDQYVIDRIEKTIDRTRSANQTFTIGSKSSCSQMRTNGKCKRSARPKPGGYDQRDKSQLPSLC